MSFYTQEEMEERLSYASKSGKRLFLSEQYGRYLLLTEDNEILFCLNALIKDRNPADADREGV